MAPSTARLSFGHCPVSPLASLIAAAAAFAAFAEAAAHAAAALADSPALLIIDESTERYDVSVLTKFVRPNIISWEVRAERTLTQKVMITDGTNTLTVTKITRDGFILGRGTFIVVIDDLFFTRKQNTTTDAEDALIYALDHCRNEGRVSVPPKQERAKGIPMMQQSGDVVLPPYLPALSYPSTLARYNREQDWKSVEYPWDFPSDLDNLDDFKRDPDQWAKQYQTIPIAIVPPTHPQQRMTVAEYNRQIPTGGVFIEEPRTDLLPRLHATYSPGALGRTLHRCG